VAVIRSVFQLNDHLSMFIDGAPRDVETELGGSCLAAAALNARLIMLSFSTQTVVVVGWLLASNARQTN